MAILMVLVGYFSGSWNLLIRSLNFALNALKSIHQSPKFLPLSDLVLRRGFQKII